MAYISFAINPLLALLALGVTPFISYSTTFYADRIEPRIYRVRGLEAINLAIVHEAMAMMRVVLAFGHEKREYKRFREQGEETVDARIDLTVRQTAFKLGVQVITAAGTAAVIGVGAYQAVQGEITAGELLVVLSYIAQVYTPLEELTNTLAALPAVVHRPAHRLRPDRHGARRRREAGRRRPRPRAGARSSFDGRRVQLQDPARRAQGRLVQGPSRAGGRRSSARPGPASRRW